MKPEIRNPLRPADLARLTAAGVLGPALDLDWRSGQLVSRVAGGAAPTFTRASTATRINSAGVVENVAANAPAVDWVPALGGWATRFEEAKTNFCRDSAFTNSTNADYGWPVQVGALFTPNYALSPAGTMTAARLQCTAANSSGIYNQQKSAGAIAAGNFCFSVWVKSNVPGVPQTVRLANFNTIDGNAFKDFIVGDDWTRISYTRSNSTSAFRQVNIVSDVNSTNDILIWGAQVELNGVSSYIPTVGGPASNEITRAADVLTLPTAGWWNRVAGSYVAESGIYPGSVTTAPRTILETGTVNDRVNLRLAENTTNPAPSTYVGNGTQTYSMALGATGNLALASEKAAVSYSTTAAAIFARNGATAPLLPQAVYSGASFAVINLGTALNGYLRRLRYWPAMKGATELAGLTG